MLEIYSIPALDSNYFWLLHPRPTSPWTYIVDPGDASPVIRALEHYQLQLAGIIITHHHHDHIDGIDELVARYQVPVFGPRSARIPEVNHYLSEGEKLSLPGLELEVMEIPGHTQDHLAYLNHGGPVAQLFCGDTLFGAGCGRLLDGTAAQLYASLQRLARLPPDTMMYCGHEYTLANLRFARAVEPDNQTLLARLEAVEELRHCDQPTLPAHLGMELETNPFLRVHLPSVRHAAEAYIGHNLATPLEVFTVVREWKNNFRED